MQAKAFFSSTEVLLGIGMLVAGLCALADGRHDMVSQALAPFGAGLVLSDAITRAARATRERVRIRVKDDE